MASSYRLDLSWAQRCLVVVAAGVSLSLATGAARAEPGYFGAYLCLYHLKKEGCNTSYQEGVTTARVDETTLRITTRGNSFTARGDVFQFAMRSAAEQTIAAGYDLFFVVEQNDETRSGTLVEGGNYNAPVTSRPYQLPGLDMTIKMSKGAKPADASANLYDAREVLRFMGVQGAAPAQTNVGAAGTNSQGVPQGDAISKLRVAADQGDAAAQSSLALRYLSGQGVPQDYVQAASWARKAADEGNAEAQLGVGMLYTTGTGVPQDRVQAQMWFDLALSRSPPLDGQDQALAIKQRDLNGSSMTTGQILDALRLARAWIPKRWHSNDLEDDATSSLRKEAEQGSAEAEVKLGELYTAGKGVPQDYGLAVSWMRKAADQGYSRGEALLGSLYFSGQGVRQDYDLAALWFRKAADQGNAEGEGDLANSYTIGKGVPQNYSLALKWLRKSADHGNAGAQDTLGLAYENGRGVQKDYALAASWYHKAVQQGNADARTNLDRLYSRHEGVPK